MTEEQSTPDSAGEKDALVSDTYREIANERAPEHLNRAILKQAAGAAQPRYSRLINWTRPMAWAATAMLSVAVVLELTSVPEPQSAIPQDVNTRFEGEAPKNDGSTVSAADAIAPAELKTEMPESEVLEETVFPAAMPGRGANLLVPEKTQLESANTPAAEIATSLRKRDDKSQLPDVGYSAPQWSNAEQAKLKDADMLLQAEELARMHSGDNREADRSAESALASRASGFANYVPACDESVRTTPEAWLECIEVLEGAGMPDAASEQRQKLISAFPNFELP